MLCDEDAEEQRQDGEVDALPDRHVRCAIARLAPRHRAHEAHEGRVRLPRRTRRRCRGRILYEEDARRGGAINNCKNQKLRRRCQCTLEWRWRRERRTPCSGGPTRGEMSWPIATPIGLAVPRPVSHIFVTTLQIEGRYVHIDMSIVAVVRCRRLNHFSEKPGMSTWKIGWVTPDRIYQCGGSTVYVNNRSVRGV